MAQAFAVEETISRPADDVWAALTDWANAPKWMSGIEMMRADGDTAEGTNLTFLARGSERPSRITQCVPGQSITLQSVQGKVTADYTYDLHPVDDRTTRIRLAAHCQTRGLLLRLLSPMLRFAIKKVDGKQLANLKRYIEAQ